MFTKAGYALSHARRHLAFLGGHATLVTGIGRHALAQGIRADLAGTHVNVIDVAEADDTPPAVSSIVVTRGSGDRRVVSLNAVGRTIYELDLYSPSGKGIHLKLDEPFAVYSRVVFDGYLRDRARDAGAQVIAEKLSTRKIKKANGLWRVQSDSGEWSGPVLVGADGANSGIAKMLAGPLSPSDMEVAFGYRAPMPANNVAPTVVAFLPGWVGYAWAFPRPDHISFGIATTQDAFEHQPLDDLLWQFMIGYYRQCEGEKVNFWQTETTNARIQTHLRANAERYAARQYRCRRTGPEDTRRRDRAIA